MPLPATWLGCVACGGEVKTGGGGGAPTLLLPFANAIPSALLLRSLLLLLLLRVWPLLPLLLLLLHELAWLLRRLRLCAKPLLRLTFLLLRLLLLGIATHPLHHAVPITGVGYSASPRPAGRCPCPCPCTLPPSINALGRYVFIIALRHVVRTSSCIHYALSVSSSCSAIRGPSWARCLGGM